MAASALLTARHLNRATLARQGLLDLMQAPNAGVAVQRVGSLQAQHPDWPPVALAARAGDPITADLAGGLDRREVVRSSLMRITIHVVAASDLWSMFAVMQPLRLLQWSLLTKVSPLTSDLGQRLLASHPAAVDALRQRPMTSLEIDRLLAAEARLEGDVFTRPAWREPETRVPVRVGWRHFAAFVPLVHVPHAGERYGRSLYALAADWLGIDPPGMDEKHGRAHVARRYLAAFGPASMQDLAAYVGRGKGGIGVWKEAIAALDDVIRLRGDDGRELLDLAESPRPEPDTPAPARLLARWDSLLLSHETTRRDRVIADEHRSAVYTKNGDVRPTFLLDGTVAGTWDLLRHEGDVGVTLTPFRPVTRAAVGALVAEAERVLQLVAPDAKRHAVDVAA